MLSKLTSIELLAALVHFLLLFFGVIGPDLDALVGAVVGGVDEGGVGGHGLGGNGQYIHGCPSMHVVLLPRAVPGMNPAHPGMNFPRPNGR